MSLPTDTPSLPARLSARLPERARAFVRRIRIRSYLSGLTAAIVLGGSYYALAQSGSTSSTTTSDLSFVGRQTIVTSVKAVGSVTFANEQQLKFNTKGTVTKVLVREGDQVKKGKVLAEIDSTSVLSDIRQSQLTIAASNLQLQQLQAERDSSILTAQNALNSATRQVGQSQTDLQETRATELQSLASTAQDILIGSEKLLDSFYGVLTVDTVARPPSDITTLEINRLLYRDWSLKDSVELIFRSGVNQATAMRQKYGTILNSVQDPDTILQALKDAQTLAETLQHLSEQIYSLLQGASTDSITFTVDALATLRSTANSNRSTAAGLVSDAWTARASLVALTNNDSIPSTTLQAKEDTLATNRESQQAKEAALQNTIRDLDVTIQLKQNSIGQQSASLTKLARTLDDYRIIAPFDGIVRRVDYQVGDNLLADTTEAKYIVLENPAYLLVTIPLDQVDVVKVQKDMPASITLDALPGRQFEGTIYQINPTPVQQSGVVSYNVDVKVPTPENLTILSGMTATVDVETARKENVLAVPNLAIRRIGNQATVQIGNGETVTVETGVTDGRFTEILSGLQEGDGVLSVNLSTTTTSQTTNADSTQQLIRNMGRLTGGGGGPR
ncbi:MAG: efflux RND transporter periplasmic adaptor subunit [Candidatus Peregrinibacteria bacterium]